MSVSEDVKELYKKTSDSTVDKNYLLNIDGIAYDNTNIVFGSFSLTEKLCSSEQLRFGECNASMLKLKMVADIGDISEKKIVLSQAINENSVAIGKFNVDSCVLTENKQYRDIVAYDNIILFNTNVSDWYNSLEFPIKMNNMLISLCAYIGVEMVDIHLINGEVDVEKTINPEDLKGITVLKSIAELNGGFFRATAEGKLEFVTLNTSLIDDYLEVKHYRSLKTENYTTDKITRLVIRTEEDDIGASAGEGDNAYIIQDNFLLYGSSTDKLKGIATTIYNAVKDITYTPYTAEHVGLPYLKCGSQISYKLVNGESFVGLMLQRTLTGTQVLKDSVKTSGSKKTEEKFSVEKELIKLKGKANLLTRSIEKNELMIINVEKGLENQITQTESDFNLKISQIQKDIDELPTVYIVKEPSTMDNYPANCFFKDIYYPFQEDDPEVIYPGDWTWEFTDESYAAHVKDIAYNEDTGETYRFLKNEDGFYWELVTDISELGYILSAIASINTDINGITLEVSQTRQELTDNYYTKVQTDSQIKQKSDAIQLNVDAEIKRAQDEEEKLNASLELKVDIDKLVSQLNMSADEISISGDRFSLNSTNTQIDPDGKITTKNIDVTGGNINIDSSGNTQSTLIKRCKVTYNSDKDAEISAYPFGGFVRCRYGDYRTFMNGNAIMLQSINSDGIFDTDAFISNDITGTYMKIMEINANGNINSQKKVTASESIEAGDLIVAKGTGISYVNGYFTVGGDGYNTNYKFWTAGNAWIDGNFGCNGTKNRIVDTPDYGKVLLNAYEMSTPMFGDIGTAQLDESGECIIFVDDIFLETIDKATKYEVFLQKYGKGDIWVDEINDNYFVVKGDAGLRFAWEIKGKQLNYSQYRLESEESNNFDAEYMQCDCVSIHDYEDDAEESTEQYETVEFDCEGIYDNVQFEDTEIYEL